MEWTPQLQVLGEVILAMFLGALVGLEREAADKPAGLRTHMLVAGAAALLVGLTNTIVEKMGSWPNATYLRGDPIRVIEAVVTAVGFLGAGTILRRNEGDRVQGLTTAASILLAAAVGISVALRQFILAVGVTMLALVTLRLIGVVEKRLFRRTSRS
ncbi:MAG: MgtC/SapB family protein [Thermoanaerobaculia bacterium]